MQMQTHHTDIHTYMATTKRTKNDAFSGYYIFTFRKNQKWIESNLRRNSVVITVGRTKWRPYKHTHTSIHMKTKDTFQMIKKKNH